MSSRKTVLETINDNSLILYCLLKNKRIKTKNLYEAVLTKDKELVLKQLLPITNKKVENLKEEYTKENCLDEILFLTDNRYRHLKEIRDIVNIDHVVEFVVSDKIYLDKLKIHYTDLIVDLLVEDFYDYKSLQLFSKYKRKIIELDNSINEKIIGNIDKFYIQKITI